MIRSIHHVSYTVSQAQRSVAFYRDGLGFEVLSDREVQGDFAERITGFNKASVRVVHLRGHGQGLELIEYHEPEGQSPAPRTCDVGSSHLCFVVEDISALRERLESLGARFLSKPVAVDGGPNAGRLCVYFLDPDGIPMELIQDP